MFNRKAQVTKQTPSTVKVEKKRHCSEEFIADFAVYLLESDAPSVSKNQEAPILNHYW